eukprot:TRINITY_DN10246_c0_g1_i1.p1 TRINITY_DN10246_c0_g1~~TRINITY_DN10246_c0_g1_i1.p1  ORF type:complete len:349 (-),score=59.27 TRINITY_DN10246_c0_g1_i1:179-1225(-)
MSGKVALVSPPPSHAVVNDFLTSISPLNSPRREPAASQALVAMNFSDALEDDGSSIIFGGSNRFPGGAPCRFAGLAFRSHGGDPEVEKVHEKKRNPRVYTFSDDWLDPVLLRALRSNEVGSIRWLLAQPDPNMALGRLMRGETPEAAASRNSILSLINEEMPGVYSFRCLRRAFCYELIEEIERRAGVGESTALASYACIMSDLGFTEAIAKFHEVVMVPLAELFFPRQAGNNGSDHRAYVVKYASGDDTPLQRHMDMSDVTLNVNLGKTYTGGKTYFEQWGRQVTETDANTRTHNYDSARVHEVEHCLGQALFHAGTQVNGADRITGGEKWNMVLWRSYDTRKEWVQ